MSYNLRVFKTREEAVRVAEHRRASEPLEAEWLVRYAPALGGYTVWSRVVTLEALCFDGHFHNEVKYK